MIDLFLIMIFRSLAQWLWQLMGEIQAHAVVSFARDALIAVQRRAQQHTKPKLKQGLIVVSQLS